MKNNKVYLPTDAIARHEDFDVWYADGETFLSIKGAWSKESDKAVIFGRMGGEMGQIKPDHKALTYYLQLERWEYVVDFKGHGPCFEVRAKDVAKLRIAVAAVIAMAIKEEYRGLSEGLKNPNASRLEKAKNWLVADKDIPYDQLPDLD